MNDIIRGICHDLLTQISNGEIKAGESLPPEMQLAKIFNTNRMNAHHAVKVLERKGLVIRKKRIGTVLKADLDQNVVSMLIKEVNKIVYLLYSKTPHCIHWNETSFQALEQVVIAAGYTVLYDHIPTSESRENYRAILKKASDAGASALVIFPDMEDTTFLANNGDLLIDFQMPVYMLNRTGEPKPLDMVSFVSMAHFSDGVTIGTLLKKHACNNIVMLNECEGNSFWGRKRYEGLLAGLQHGDDNNIPIPENILSTPQGYTQTVELIKQSLGNIIIVSVNNQYAAQFIDFAQQQGLKTPADYQLITFDDSPEFRSYNLTSMAVPMQKIGEVFGKLICDKSWLEEFRGKVSIKVNSELVIRKTFN